MNAITFGKLENVIPGGHGRTRRDIAMSACGRYRLTRVGVSMLAHYLPSLLNTIGANDACWVGGHTAGRSTIAAAAAACTAHAAALEARRVDAVPPPAPRRA